MKILHAAETIKGGVASYLEEVLSYQKEELGAENLRLLAPQDHKDCLPELQDIYIAFPRQGRSLGGFMRFALALFREVRAQRPQAVFFHSTFAGFFGRLVLPLTFVRTKVFYCPHGWSFGMKTSKVKNLAYRLFERVLCNGFTDRTVCISQHEYDLAVGAGIRPEKLVMIYNGIRPVELPDVAKNPQTERPVELLFVGRLDEQKGFDILLEAIAPLDTSRYNLTVIGGAVGNAQTYTIPDHVRTLGWLPRAEVLRHVCQADALVMPSRWEGLSILALEAMACATALFASTESSLPEQVEEGVSGRLFDISVPASLTRCIEESFGNIMTLHAQGDKGREKFLEFFTAESMNSKTLFMIIN